LVYKKSVGGQLQTNPIIKDFGHLVKILTKGKVNEMIKLIRSKRIILGIATLVLTMLAFTPSTVFASGPCFRGSYTSSDNGHHYIAFETGKENANSTGWVIVKKPAIVKTFEVLRNKPMNVWGPADSIGEVRAGFPWPDFAPWEYSFTPWDDFEICKQ
jgi:hypothetical protein